MESCSFICVLWLYDLFCHQMYGLLVSNNFILQFLREEYVLDEDDYELLEYNNVIPRRKVEDIYLIVVSAALN